MPGLGVLAQATIIFIPKVVMAAKSGRKYGKNPTTFGNVLKLVEALLVLADGKITVPPDKLKAQFKVEWVSETQLWVSGTVTTKPNGRTKTVEKGIKKEDLLALVEAYWQGKAFNPAQNKNEAIQDVIYCLADLGILDDSESQNKNKGFWIFSLTLKHPAAEIKDNLRVIEDKWKEVFGKLPQPNHPPQPTATLVEENLSRLDPTNPQLSAAEWGKIAQDILAHRLALTSNPLTNRKGIALNQSDIYVPLGLVERRKPEQVSKQDPQREEEKITPISEDEFFQQVLQQGKSPQSQGRRIAIIGEAGSGKTTRLQKIADWILQQDLGLPIWIPLAELKEQTIIDYLEGKWLKLAGFEGATASLKQQKERLWLLLDGLDEMTARVEGRHLSQLLIGWIQSARVIITCRVNVWEADANAFSGFDVFKNLPLDVKQVESFIRRFFQ
ncbi:MAG: hypothetical protein Fur0025_44910 [Oscillatoriaceae cyanobacterium]